MIVVFVCKDVRSDLKPSFVDIYAFVDVYVYVFC
jgi:hypothetical protein